MEQGRTMAESTTENIDALGSVGQQILRFERLRWKHPGAKESAIRERFALSATHYYQILNSLADSEAAYRFDPMLIKQVRAKRFTRLRSA